MSNDDYGLTMPTSSTQITPQTPVNTFNTTKEWVESVAWGHAQKVLTDLLIGKTVEDTTYKVAMKILDIKKDNEVPEDTTLTKPTEELDPMKALLGVFGDAANRNLSP
jgi:hypothetical protein